MAKNFTGEILHGGAVRTRITGEGTFQYILYSLDNIELSILNPITMATATSREPLVLANLNSQRISIYGEVTTINEWFNISKITLYVKPVATSYPL